MKFSNF